MIIVWQTGSYILVASPSLPQPLCSSRCSVTCNPFVLESSGSVAMEVLPETILFP